MHEDISQPRRVTRQTRFIDLDAETPAAGYTIGMGIGRVSGASLGGYQWGIGGYRGVSAGGGRVVATTCAEHVPCGNTQGSLRQNASGTVRVTAERAQ